MEASPIVTITGISGYVGSQVCLHFLKAGGFRVRGTVRSTTNAAKIEPLKQAFGEHFDRLELVEADLLNADSLINAIQGSEFVVHTASPFPITKPKNEEVLIRPAVDGTLAVMEGCKQAKVKRCVITSSVASIMGQSDKKKVHFTAEDWSDVNWKGLDPYSKSKTLAEKAAWDFVAALPEGEKFELATINPALVIGPNLNKCQFSSGDIVKKFMLKELPGAPLVQFGMVDVRDVAKAHYEALVRPDAAGNRFILCSDSIYMTEMGQILHKDWGENGYKVTNKQIAKPLLWFASIFDQEASTMYDLWGKQMQLDNKKTSEMLGIDFIKIDQSLKEMVVTLIETGYIPDKRKNKE